MGALDQQFTVTFDSQGSAVASVTVDHSDTIPRPSDPTRSAYTFWGWYKEFQCLSKWNFSTDTVTADITLYARWPVPSTLGMALIPAKNVTYQMGQQDIAPVQTVTLSYDFL